MWNNRDMVITFSAGNEGIDANSDGIIDNDSMGAPATAKNVLTVGASENQRSDNYPCDTGLSYTTCASQGTRTASSPGAPHGRQIILPTSSRMTFPPASRPTEAEVRSAARLLANDYAANRIYLIYHKEVLLADAEAVFATWREFCPREVEIVPTLVLRAYDNQKSAVFATNDRVSGL